MTLRLFSHDHTPASTRVVVAMSGGVDSSVTAALVAEAGYDVVGITLQLYDHGLMAAKKGACCAGQDIYDAQRVAEQIGFPHYVLDYEQTFRQEVMEDFVQSYLHGETPIPCLRCNQKVKFRDLLTTAKDLGASALVTGHYVRRVEGGAEGAALLCRAIDLSRDQSYFMFATTPEQLNFLRFPLGDMKKTAVREHAHRFGLAIAEKPDSQDICFVPDGKYANIVEKLRPGSLEAGDIVDVNGTVLGRHTGIINFTIGQRKGLALGTLKKPEGQSQNDADKHTTTPLYVIALDPQNHRVVVGPRELLACSRLILKDESWLISQDTLQDRTVLIKYRSTQSPVPAHIQFSAKKGTCITLHQPEFGVSPGQACVVYQDDQVLGGGWIAQAPTQGPIHSC